MKNPFPTEPAIHPVPGALTWLTSIRIKSSVVASARLGDEPLLAFDVRAVIAFPPARADRPRLAARDLVKTMSMHYRRRWPQGQGAQLFQPATAHSRRRAVGRIPNAPVSGRYQQAEYRKHSPIFERHDVRRTGRGSLRKPTTFERHPTTLPFSVTPVRSTSFRRTQDCFSQKVPSAGSRPGLCSLAVSPFTRR